VKTVSVERLLEYIDAEIKSCGDEIADAEDGLHECSNRVLRQSLRMLRSEIRSGRLSPDPAVPVREPAGDWDLDAIFNLADNIALKTEDTEIFAYAREIQNMVRAHGGRGGSVEAFADEVISLITTEQAAMSRLYSKHSYGINKVCNRLKLFVGDLLKKSTPHNNHPGGLGER
jgi:hypothetical protein